MVKGLILKDEFHAQVHADLLHVTFLDAGHQEDFVRFVLQFQNVLAFDLYGLVFFLNEILADQLVLQLTVVLEHTFEPVGFFFQLLFQRLNEVFLVVGLNKALTFSLNSFSRALVTDSSSLRIWFCS